MINDTTMEFDVCPTHRKNGSKTNCITVKSGSDIQLTALEGQLQKAEERCNSIKKKLDYMKMVYESTGPTVNDIVSPRSVKVESPAITKIHILDTPTNELVNQRDNAKFNETEMINSSKIEKLESNKNTENHMEKLSDELILNNWSERSLHQVYSVSNERLFDCSHPKIIGSLPKEPEIILKLTDRSASVHDKIQPRILYSASQADKSDCQPRDELPHRIIRKKRRRLKRSNSRSTTASKHTAVLPEIKHARKVHKRRVHRIQEPAHFESPLNERKKLTNKNDREVVEIYHNAAVQSVQSFSETSSKQHLKMVPQVVDDDAGKSAKNPCKNHGLKITPEAKNNIHVISSPERKIPEQKSQNVVRRQEMQMKDAYGDVANYCCNSVSTPNYQQATCASKLKRIDRCYFSARFNLRNIPFVVGTSVTPSHNIGLNIQQVLSLMKTKQPGLATEMRPFFIKKMGKELNPVVYIQEPLQYYNNSELGQNINHNESKNDAQEGKNIECKTPKPSGIMNNPMEIRNVMMRLHCQFEQMQTKYEKLQVEVNKSNDETLLKELNELEDELNAKESEISAVVGLYNEMIALKSQIHGSYHKKNGLIHMAEDYVGKIPSRVQPMTILNYPRNKMKGVRTPATSTRLTGLLRQIQSFQQQLISS